MNSVDNLIRDVHELKFALTEEDSWALLKALDRAFPGTPAHPARGWVKAIFVLLKWATTTLPMWLLSICLLLISTSNARIEVWQVLLVAILGVIVGVSMTLMLPERKLHPFVRAFMGLGRQRTMILSREGVRAVADGSSNFIPWDVYSRVELSNGFVLLYRGGVADFIPGAAFSGEEQADEIARFIAARIKEARSHD